MLSNCVIYYHMPFHEKEDGSVYSNPVIGFFIESLMPYFKEIKVIGYIAVQNKERLTYKLPHNSKVSFHSLGPQGQFWDFVQNRIRTKQKLKVLRNKYDILLLRLPSYKSYLIWKYLGKPQKTVMLFVGNPLYNPYLVHKNFIQKNFRRLRSWLNNKRMRQIGVHPKSVLLANSKSQLKVWGDIIEKPLRLVHTSSITQSNIFKERELTKKDKIKLLFVGRVSLDKGITELLESLKVIDEDNPKRYHLDIVGPEDDLQGMELQSMIHQYELDSIVTYHGLVPFGNQLFKFYQTSDIYILPSYHEGMPHTVWEAMSQGLPVIATQVGGMADFFTNREDILFIKIKNSKDIAEKIQVLEKDVIEDPSRLILEV